MLENTINISLPFPSISFVVLGFIMSVILIYGKNRRLVLIFSLIGTGFFGIYNFLEVALIGGYISMLGVLNTAYQASVSDKYLEKTALRRFFIASGIGIAGSALMINTGQDLLPLCAFLIVCYADCLSNKLKIISIYLFTSYLWGAYAFIYHDYLYAAANFSMIFFYLPRIYKLYKSHKNEKATTLTHLKAPY